MTEPAHSIAFLNGTYEEALKLAQEARDYLAYQEPRDRAELVTDDRAALRVQLEAATGERIAALEAVGHEHARDGSVREHAAPEAGRTRDPEHGNGIGRSPEPAAEKARAPMSVDRDLGL